MNPRLESALLALAILLRVYLAIVNAEANDDHLTVIRMIADEGRFAGVRDAWEGFQPKLYHATVALLWKLSPWDDLTVRVRLAQLVSCAAGIATLLVLRRGLSRVVVSPRARLMAFALAALNPALIGLNAQATNDSFVILFSTLAITYAAEFFEKGSRTAFVLMTGSVVLAVLSKGNGLVVFGAISATAAVLTWSQSPLARRQLVKRAGLFIATVLVLTATFGPFRGNWEDTGNPFAINGDPAPWPHFVERTYVYRPGVTSIVDTYFTFRLADMLRHPALTNAPDVYPLHRTSLWSQLYGRTHSTHFAQHPPSWRNRSSAVSALTRLILIVALLPTLLLVAGMIRVLGRLLMWLRRPWGPAVDVRDALLAFAAWGYVAFIIVYTLTYRDFSTMKAEFLLPALPAYAVLFARELDRAEALLVHAPWATRILRSTLAFTLVLYVVNVTVLAVQLT